MSDACALLATFQGDIKAHAILASIGFLILLPLGILLARYSRTFVRGWFYGHVLFQAIFAGPIIITAFALGVRATNIAGSGHLNDAHKKTGVALFVLYIVQLLVGLATHFFKGPTPRILWYRAPHQWLHIALGLAILSLAFYQVHRGYTVEWPTLVINPHVPSDINNAWIAWIVVVFSLYFLGLALLPRQIAQEAASRNGKENGASASPKEGS